MLYVFFWFQGEILKLEFLEEGQYYNQTLILDKKSIQFDVPKHAGIEETQYLYDYDAVSLDFIVYFMKTCKVARVAYRVSWFYNPLTV